MIDKKIPALRFAGFTDAWEKRNIGDFLVESKILGSRGDVAKKITVKLWSKGVVPKKEIYSGSSATQYYVRKSGQFMYGKLDFLNQAFGIVPIELDGYESTLDSPAFDFLSGIDEKFFLEYISRKEFYEYQGIIANGSRKAKRIHSETFFAMPLVLPNLPEQTAIGNFFAQLDLAIALQERKCQIMTTLKKTLLKKLFPENDANEPALRFAGFTDAWEKRQLKRVLEERKLQKTQSDDYPLVSFTVEKGVTPKTERYDREQLVVGDKEAKKYKVTKFDDIVYNPANLKFGAIARNKFGNAVFSPIYVTFEVNEQEVLPSYLEMVVTQRDFITYALQFQQGTVYERQSVSPEDLLSLFFKKPELPEQTAIGNFFAQLDLAIALQEKKLENMKIAKKTLLKLMFL